MYDFWSRVRSRAEKVIDVLTEEPGLERDQVKKRGKNGSIERIKTNVDKQAGDEIREYDLAGVKVSKDYKRNYPCKSGFQSAWIYRK